MSWLHALGPWSSLEDCRRTLPALPDVPAVPATRVPAVVGYSRYMAVHTILRVRGTSEMAMLAAMCMMAVERSRGGYARV